MKLAGALTPAGNVIVAVIVPVVVVVPLLVTVNGTLLAMPTTKLGEGWPMLVVKSGTPATGVVGVIGLAALLAVLVSPPPLLVALNTGCMPTVLTSGVTGTCSVLLPPVVIGPGCVQLTV